MIRRIAILFALVSLLNLPAHAQNDLKTMLFSKAYPNILTLKELNAEWRVMNVGGVPQDNNNGGGGFMALFTGMLGSVVNVPTYYTKGDTLTIGTETFLVAYHFAAKPVSIAALMAGGGGGNANPPAAEAYTGDTKISLSLVNLKTASSFTDIHPFDLKAELEAHKALPAAAESESNLKQIGTALQSYLQANENRLPPMKEMAKIQEVLQPYYKNKQIFLNPESKEPYRANAALSEKKMTEIASPDETVAFYEATPAKDGTRGICFVNGEVKRIREEDWPALKSKSKIP